MSFIEQRRIDNLLNGLHRDTPVFRIFSCKRFLQLLKESKLSLIKPKKWDDPFENFILSTPAIDNHGTPISLSSLSESYFGQCWTLNKETDAMWRIYSPYKDGIKVSTTVGKLFDVFYDHRKEPELECYFGLVEYKTEQNLINLLLRAKEFVLDRSGIESAKSLLLKREEFSHEAEARLIYVSFCEDEKSRDVYSFTIDPNTLFDDITLDPRISDSDQKKISDEITINGCTLNILKSSLYSLPNFKIVLQ